MSTTQMNKLELATKFAEMCNMGLDKCPTSVTLTMVNTTVNAANRVSPEWFIQYVGPFFYEKRVEITAKNIDYFAARSWSEQRASWGFLPTFVADKFEATIKDIITHLKVHDPDAMVKIPQSLLKIYCQYLIECKNLATCSALRLTDNLPR